VENHEESCLPALLQQPNEPSVQIFGDVNIDDAIWQAIDAALKHYLGEYHKFRHATDKPPLFFECSDVCHDARKYINLLDNGVEPTVVTGKWVGNVNERFRSWSLKDPYKRSFPYGHDVLKLEYRGVSKILDPTYIQFDDTIPFTKDGCFDAMQHFEP
jgi:hypothetical protein